MASRTKKWTGQFAQIVGASFGFLSDEDITKISVKSVHVPSSFDTLGNPVVGGLYDPSLGPYDKGVVYVIAWNFFNSALDAIADGSFSLALQLRHLWAS